MPEWDDFFNTPDLETMGNNWVRLDVLASPMGDKYAWAIPNKRALRILSNFAPLIEVGAGKGYWANQLRNLGVDIVAYDKRVAEDCWTTVEKGGPSVLSTEIASNRSLFLCYPDDTTDLAMKCLKRFTGDYIIHVGELVTTGTLSGSSQAPFGRTTGSEFQVALAESFHCLLETRLPHFPFSKDCITVWKRTEYVQGKSAFLNTQEEEEEEEEEEGSNGDDDTWAAIPWEERLPTHRAAPCLAHLLD